MKNYIAKTIFKIVSGDGDHTPQYDEKLIIINAYTKKEAMRKCLTLSIDNEDSFVNDSGEKVLWKFIGVAELCEIGKLDNGAEIYSTLREVEDEDLYLSMLKFREGFLQQHEQMEIA